MYEDIQNIPQVEEASHTSQSPNLDIIAKEPLSKVKLNHP